MLFSLINALSSFKHFINNILCLYLNVFCTAYINNILIYSNNLAKYWKYINLVLKALYRFGLQLDINKCKFYKMEIMDFEFIIFTNSV